MNGRTVTKAPFSLRVTLPSYPAPGPILRREREMSSKHRWQDVTRRLIMKRAATRNINRYAKTDFLQVEVILYVKALDELLDLDNMAKLVGDALQGNKTGQGMKAHYKR